MNLNDIRQKLESNIAAGKPLLADTPIDDAAYHTDIAKVIDVDRFKLTDAKVDADEAHVWVCGRGDILRFAKITITIGFEAVDSDIFLTFEAAVDGVSAFGALERFNSPLKSAVISWRYGPLLSRDTPDWIPPISLAAFQARLALPGMEPLAVVVYPPAFDGETQWRIRGNFAPRALPGLDLLLHWLNGSKVADLFPEKLTALGGLSLQALDIGFDPTAGSVMSVSLAIAMDKKSWSPGIGKLKLDDLLLSVDYTHADNGKASVSARVIGQLEVTAQSKIAFSLTHAGSTGLSALEIESQEGLPLPDLQDLGDLIGVDDFAAHLPESLRYVKKALLRQMRISFDGKAGRLNNAGLEIEVRDPVPLAANAAHLGGIDLQLDVDPSATPPLQGELAAVVVAGNLMLPVDAVIAQDLQLTARLQSLDPRNIFADLPEAFPHIALSDVRVQLSTAGSMSFSAAIEMDFRQAVEAFQIPLPESITKVNLSSFDARLDLGDGSWGITASSDLEVHLIDTQAGQLWLKAPTVTIAAGPNGIGLSSKFQLRGCMQPDPNVVLDFQQIDCAIDTGSKKWTVTADQATLQLFGQPPISGFSGALSDEAISLKYAGDKKLTLVNWEGIGAVDLNNFTLFVRKPDTATAVESDPPQNTDWHFGVSGQASVRVAGLSLPELQLDVTDQSLQAIADHPQFPPIVIDGWPAPAPRADLSFDQIVLGYQTGADHSARWRLDAENGSLKFGNIPKMVQAYFRDLNRQCSFHIGDDGAWVKGAVGVDVPFPELKFRLGKETEIDLGQPRVRLDTVGIGFGNSPFLSVELTVGLPQKPQWIAALVNDHCGFELKVAKALQLAVTSSPFRAIKDGQHRKDKPGLWWYAQLQDAGDYWIRVPEFEYGGQTWDLLAAVDSVGDPGLPLAPLKLLLEALGVPSERLKYFPNSLPLSGLDLKKLNTLYDQVKRLLGGKMPAEFDDIIRRALAAIGRGLGYMPDDFQDYMVCSVPKSFSLRLGVDPKGGAVIGLETGGDPLRLLFPSMMSGIPELIGIELKAFSMGAAAGGLLSVVTADGHIDRFDLVSIGAIIAVHDKDWSHSLRNRIYLEKVFALIPNEFPIPILMSYDHVGWDLMSWLGLGMHTHFYFPEQPHALWNWIATAIPFFSNPDYHLHTEPHPRLAGDFTIGENYLTLPKYLGADPDKAYGLDHKLPALDVDQSLSFILDGLKFVNPGFIIQSVPLYKGPETHPELLPFRINRSHIDFGPLSFDVAWCATTQEEFKKVRHLPAVADALKAANDPDVLQSLPKAAQGPAYDRGFVLLFSEETAIHPIAGVKGQFGMALTGGGGFETGIQFTGTIAEQLAITLRGDISVPAPPGSGVSLHGAFSLNWGDTDLIAAVDCQVTVTDHSFELEHISLRLHGDDCVLSGTLIIDAQKGMTIGGQFRWAFGDSQPAIDVSASATFSGAGIDVAVTDTGRTKVFDNSVKALSAYLYPGQNLKGARIGFDTGPLNDAFSAEFGKLSAALDKEVQALWQDYQTYFKDFSSVFTDVESIRKNLPPALGVIIAKAPGEIHQRIDSKIDEYWPHLVPGKETVKKKARDYADRKAQKPLANLSDLRKKIPNANTDQLKQALLALVNDALNSKSITISLKEISKLLPDIKFDIPILQPSQIEMLENAKKYIPQIPEKRKVSDDAWREHYFRGKLKEFVDGISQSIKKGLEPPRLIELSAGTKLAKDSPTVVTADVKVVYRDPKHPFEKAFEVDLRNLLASLPSIAKAFATGTEPTPPAPPPPPEPG
jgi:hypothetical protein